MMKGEYSQSGLESLVTERQRLGHSLYRRNGPGFPLGDHGKRRFDSDYPAIYGFIVARASTHVGDALSIT